MTTTTTMWMENSRIIIPYFLYHHYEQIHCTKSELTEIPRCEPITSYDVGVSAFPPIARTNMLMVQVMYICTREFSRTRNGTRNIGPILDANRGKKSSTERANKEIV